MQIGYQVVSRVSSTTLVGVVIDEKLSRLQHVQSVTNKVSKGIGILSKARKCLSISSLTTLYYMFIYPHLTYCIEVWGSASKLHLSALHKTQKRIVRIIKSLPCKASTMNAFHDLNVLNIHTLYTYRIVLFMFKYMRGMLPDVYSN